MTNNIWPNERRITLLEKLALFIIWPFGAWLFCLKDPRRKSSFVIFFFFSLLLCWHMAPAGLSNSYDDFLGILDEFNSFSLSSGEFFHEVVAFINISADAPKDLYQDFLNWFTKLFTENYHFMFLLAAIPVAILQLYCLKRIALDNKYIVGFYGLVALLLMLFPRDIITVQNPRFTTGYWLFVSCVLYCFSNQKVKIKYLIPLVLLPAIHSAMWLALILVLTYLVLPKGNTRYLEILAIVSIPFIYLDPNLSSYFNLNYSFLPNNIVKWTELYSSDEFYETYILNTGRSGFWWVDEFFNQGRKIIYIVMALQVINGFKKRDASNEEGHAFYPFFLFSFFFINLIQFIPVLGQRYMWMWQVFVFYEWYKTFHFSRKGPYWLLLLFSSWFMIRRYGYVLGGAMAVIMPPDVFYMPLPYLMGEGLYW